MKGNLLDILCNARNMEHIEIINPYHYQRSFF